MTSAMYRSVTAFQDTARYAPAQGCRTTYRGRGVAPRRSVIDESQELYYPAIMRAIQATGFTGYVAQEFVPAHTPMASLEDAFKRCNV